MGETSEQDDQQQQRNETRVRFSDQVEVALFEQNPDGIGDMEENVENNDIVAENLSENQAYSSTDNVENITLDNTASHTEGVVDHIEEKLVNNCDEGLNKLDFQAVNDVEKYEDCKEFEVSLAHLDNNSTGPTDRPEASSNWPCLDERESVQDSPRIFSDYAEIPSMSTEIIPSCVVSDDPKMTAVPGLSCGPEITTALNISCGPDMTTVPEMSTVPVRTHVTEMSPVTEMTQIPKTTTVPENTSVTEMTSGHGMTSVPEITNVPEMTSAPDMTNVPGMTSASEMTNVPEMTSTPGMTSLPENTSIRKMISVPVKTSNFELTSGSTDNFPGCSKLSDDGLKDCKSGKCEASFDQNAEGDRNDCKVDRCEDTKGIAETAADEVDNDIKLVDSKESSKGNMSKREENNVNICRNQVNNQNSASELEKSPVHLKYSENKGNNDKNEFVVTNTINDNKDVSSVKGEELVDVETIENLDENVDLLILRVRE
jgi:hypothetical protein